MSTETLPVDRIQRAFEELRTQKTLIDNCSLIWKNLSDHYSSLEKNLAERSRSLELNLEAIESETQQALESIERKDSSLPQCESSASALVEERLASVIAEIENPEARQPSSLHDILRWYSRRMDSAGLWRYMMPRQKELEVLRAEISEAVAESIDPERLVLDAVEDFLSHPDETAPDAGGEGSWAVGVLVRTLSEFEGKKAPELPQSIRDRAAALAERWRLKHAGKKGNAEMKEVDEGEAEKEEIEGAEARTFLRLVMAFDLRSRFEEDFLVKLVIENVPRKEMAKVASRLGFIGKIEDFVKLVKNGKEIEAIYFANECGLAEKFSPVPLLKSYLQNSRKYANGILRKGNQSASAMEESNTWELNALKSIVTCVETLNLEHKFTIETLKKRILAIENLVSDRKKKKSLDSSKPHTKRTRQGVPFNARPTKSARTSNALPYVSYTRYAAQASRVLRPAHLPYNYTSGQVGFDAHSRRPSMSQHYNAAEPVSGSHSVVSYGGAPMNYGGYNNYAAAPAPAHPQYP